MTPRTCNFWGLKLFESLWFFTYFIFFLWLSSECVSALVHHIHFHIKFACSIIYNFSWKFHIIIIDRYPVSSRKFYFRYVFSDNFILIIAFFSLVVSDLKTTSNSVGVLRWVTSLLIWWSYDRDKLGYKSNNHRRIWIPNLL